MSSGYDARVSGYVAVAVAVAVVAELGLWFGEVDWEVVMDGGGWAGD